MKEKRVRKQMQTIIPQLNIQSLKFQEKQPDIFYSTKKENYLEE